jgi:hypothetical protein
MTFTFRPGQRYTIEIILGGAQCLVSNDSIADQTRALGFSDVKVVGVGRNRTIEAVWLQDDATMTVRRIKGKIDTKSEYPLAALLQGLGDAKELQPPKGIPSKGSKGSRNKRRKGRKS